MKYKIFVFNYVSLKYPNLVLIGVLSLLDATPVSGCFRTWTISWAFPSFEEEREEVDDVATY